MSRSAWLNPKFLEGQKPPPLPLASPDNIDFYNQHAFGYAMEGRTLKSGGETYRMTADHYWFLNFCPVKLNLPGKNQPGYGFPIWSQADDYVFKQLEEAQQAQMASMLFTGRGYGKSIIAISLTHKQYFLVDRSFCVISASADSHANTAWQVFKETVDGTEELHPTLRQKRLKDDQTFMRAGEEIFEGDVKRTVGSLAQVEKIIYANNPGKTKGRRLDGQHFEECLGYGTKVLMHDCSFKEVQNIAVGDSVMGVDGAAKAVVSTCTGTDEMFWVRQQKGIDYQVNSKHKLYLEQRMNSSFYKDDGPKLYTVGELDSLIASRRKATYGAKADCIVFPEQPVIVEPYYIGAWLGDGRQNNDVLIINKYADAEILEYVQDYAGRLNSRVTITQHKLTEKCIYAKIQNKRGQRGILMDDLRREGIINNKHIPAKYLYNSEQVRLQVLAGLIDTDGNLTKRTESYSFAYEYNTTLPGLAQQILFLAGSLGFQVTIKKRWYTKSSKPSYRIGIRGDIWRIPVRVTRKRPPADWKPTSNPLHTQIKIEPAGQGRYYGFTLAAEKPEDHLFLLEDFTVTHNCGDWTGSPLDECVAASEGTWRVGGIWKPKFVIFTGTGGTVRSAQAKEMFMDPLTYGIYPVVQHDGRKTGIFMPTYKKYGGFYEQQGVVKIVERTVEGMPTGKVYDAGYVELSGICDEAGAKAELELQRKRREGNAKILDKFTQEYPFDVDECFRQSGASVFQRHLLAQQKTDLTVLKKYREPDRGNLIWLRNGAGKKTGVAFKKDPHGKILIWEHPPTNERGEFIQMKHAYIGGLDSIDQSKEDSIGKDGSKLCLLIKKRQMGVEELSNLYVCAYADRPEGPVEDAYDNVLKVLTYYNCKVNVEYTKLSIVPYFKAQKEYWRFIQRPKIAQSDKNHGSQSTTLIGTQMTEPIRIYGTGKIKNYIEQFWMFLFFVELVDQLLEYTVEKKTKFDWVIAMMLCEIADEDMAELIPGKIKEAEPVIQYGYFIDPYTGYQTYGALPGQDQGSDSLENQARRAQKAQRESAIRWVDGITGEAHTVDNDPLSKEEKSPFGSFM